MLLMFGLLAYRTETNDAALNKNAHDVLVAQYQTCLATAERTRTINPGRVALTQLLQQLVESADTLTAQEKLDAVDVLKDGLVVPQVKCGNAP
jgi:hypothetical protein